MPDSYDPKGPLMSSGKDDWQTPPKVLDCVHEMTAVIGLDPCAGQDTDLAVVNYRDQDNGLALPWTKRGLVYVNPPYSELKLWVPKVVEESKADAEIIMLIPARTETINFQLAMRWANSLCFVAGRLKYLDDGKPSKHSAPFPSAVLYYGSRWAAFADAFHTLGHCMDRRLGWNGFQMGGDHVGLN